MTLIMLS